MIHTVDLKEHSLKIYCLWCDLKNYFDDRKDKCLSSQREQHMKCFEWAAEQIIEDAEDGFVLAKSESKVLSAIN